MLTSYTKAPFPYNGGKRHAAPLVWSLLGDPMHYVEPFAGSLAVLLERPHPCNRTYYSETCNDADGLVINAYRAIQWQPETTAEACSWPVSECVPAGTLIATPAGQVPIEHLRAGMVVYGHDGQRIVETTIQDTMQQVSDRPLVSLGPLVLTENHPVWTAEAGYIPAGTLTAFHHIATIHRDDRQRLCNGRDHDGTQTVSLVQHPLSAPEKPLAYTVGTEAVLLQHVSNKRTTPSEPRLSPVWSAVSSNRIGTDVLWQSLRRWRQASARAALHDLWTALSRPPWQPRHPVLFSGVPQEENEPGPQRQASRGSAPRLECPWRAREIDRLFALGAQSVAVSGLAEERTTTFSRTGLSTFPAWRQSAADVPATAARGTPGMAYGDDGTNQCAAWESQGQARARSQTLQVQVGYCRTCLAHQCRSGWSLPQGSHAPGTRYQTGCHLDGAGMDHPALQQSRHHDQAGSRYPSDRGGRVVYNLQTDTGNYFAHDILVHNCCKQARQAHLLAWAQSGMLDLLAGSPEWCDPQMAGWWLYSVCCQIGAFHGAGPWTADPVTGRLVKRGTQAIGVPRNRPHLSDNGQGVHRPQLREPGVSRDRPHLSNNGVGVNHAGLREPGVWRARPHLSNNGQGVNHAGLREPGVKRALPHLGDNGQGVHRPQLREPGIGDDPEFHPLTMPELRRWFRWLSARLRHVRLVHGDWSRVCTEGARLTLPVRKSDGVCGVFLDAPYSPSERDGALYRVDGPLHDAVQTWCLATQADPRTRIVLAGYAGEYPALEAAGWTVHEWYTTGFLRGGYGNIDGTSQQHRERLWASPHCVRQEARQMGLFASKE